MNKNLGVTLIELMIVVAIVAVLSVLGMVTYDDYVKKANMNLGIHKMLEDIQFMNKIFMEQGTYSPSGNYPTLPIESVLSNTQKPLYKIKFSSKTASATDFNLVLVPICNATTNNQCVCISQDSNLLYKTDQNCSGSNVEVCKCVNQ